MNINLSWDLFIVVFFAVVTAYSFIIGRNQTLKVITASYISILCADGLGNIFSKYLANSEAFMKIMKLFSVGSSIQAIAFFKVLLLIVLIVIIAVKGVFDFRSEDDSGMAIRIITLIVLGVLSAGLMLGSMLIFVSGSSLVTALVSNNNNLTEIYGQSRLVKVMLDFANIWFILPGIALIVISYFSKK